MFFTKEEGGMLGKDQIIFQIGHSTKNGNPGEWRAIPNRSLVFADTGITLRMGEVMEA